MSLGLLCVFQAVEGLLDATSGADADLLLRYRECHLLVLKALQDGRAYGPQWCNKQITRLVDVLDLDAMCASWVDCGTGQWVKPGLCLHRCLIECRDEYKYNVEAVELLIRNHLVNMQQYDVHLAQVQFLLLFCHACVSLQLAASQHFDSLFLPSPSRWRMGCTTWP